MMQNWKVRKEAYAQLEVLFKAATAPGDEVFATFGTHTPFNLSLLCTPP
jgi:hypothetical protein